MRDVGCYITLLSDNSISDDSSDILLYFKPDNTWVEIA